MTLKDRVAAYVGENPGLTDRKIATALLGAEAPQQPVNIAARALASAGSISRVTRADGKIGNYPSDQPPTQSSGLTTTTSCADGLSEDDVKRAVAAWLASDGWAVDVRWGHERGIDIEATRDDARWVIEAKGCGSRQPMRVNYFIAMLGETLQRMADPAARYSIALPDMQQYRRLWDRLPALARSRTTITAIFVADDGTITHLS